MHSGAMKSCKRIPLYPPSLRERVDFLLEPASYPEATSVVNLVETHFACVFIADEYVYKLKKPLRYPEMDLGTLDARVASCREEVRLNRPLAPGVYMGVALLRMDAHGAMSLGEQGRVVDALVKMKRLAAEHFLDARILAGDLETAEIEPAARKLVSFYQGADCEPAAELEPLRKRLVSLERELSGLLLEPVGADLCARLLDWLERRGHVLGQRPRRELHGDLRPEHVFVAPEPAFIDRLEFSRALRVQDPVDELAFLLLECSRLGKPAPAEKFIGVYREMTGDVAPADLEAFYLGRRALLWAVLSARHLSRGLDTRTWSGRARGYVDFGMRATECFDR